MQTAYYVILLSGTLIFTCLIPLTVVYILYKQKRIEDIRIENRSERNLPYLYGIASTAVWCFFLWYVLKMPHCIIMMACGATIALILVAIMNYWWKISAHLSCMGALIGSVAGFSWYTGHFNLWLLPTLCFVALLLMYARLYLKAHTPMQIVCGFLLGLIITFSASLI